jgi:stage II sporulation protein D
MGALIPGLVLQMGTLRVPARQEHDPTQMPTQGTVQQYPTVQTPVFVPVLTPGDTVQIMELDNYLLGVVLAEMPVYFEEEALKAQAVAARTCALLCCREGKKHSGGAICADPSCCQAYMPEQAYLDAGGKIESVDKVRKVISETSGQVLTYEGELIQATYFSCSGGRTEDAAAVWGGDVPYLQSVDSPGEEAAYMFTDNVQLTKEIFQQKLGRRLTGSVDKWLGEVTRTKGGGVATMVIGGKTYTGTQLRTLLELNSTAFTMEAQGGNVVITTWGKGHRVGMSQYGAEAMAVKGSSYREILQHYYPQTRIDKISALQ